MGMPYASIIHSVAVESRNKKMVALQCLPTCCSHSGVVWVAMGMIHDFNPWIMTCKNNSLVSADEEIRGREDGCAGCQFQNSKGVCNVERFSSLE